MKSALILLLILCGSVNASSVDLSYRLQHRIEVVIGVPEKSISFKKVGGFPFAQYAHVRGNPKKLAAILYRYQDHQWFGWRTSKNAIANVQWQEKYILKSHKLVLSIDTPDQIKAFEYAVSNDIVEFHLSDYSEL